MHALSRVASRVTFLLATLTSCAPRTVFEPPPPGGFPPLTRAAPPEPTRDSGLVVLLIEGERTEAADEQSIRVKIRDHGARRLGCSDARVETVRTKSGRADYARYWFVDGCGERLVYLEEAPGRDSGFHLVLRVLSRFQLGSKPPD